jgi:hypothetical protein
MKIFDVSKDIRVVCESGKTRNGFKHTATLFVNGRECDSAKVNYLNRTWERYDFESVLEKLADKTDCLSDEQRAVFKDYIKNYGDEDSKAMMRSIGTVAMMGELMAGDSKKSKNDWKARMIKAGLGNKGLDMPEDWDRLSEDEKERRLNNVIGELRK